jgi:thymidylate synthase (FAD)
MKIINQSWEWIQKPVNPLAIIELAGRTCYKSETRITSDSAAKFVKMILEQGHESVIEHVSASVRFITNRSVTHELLRHRLCSFSQESTRYVAYKSDIEFIQPVWWNDPGFSEKQKQLWLDAMQSSENFYHAALTSGAKPEQAREVLAHSLKTEVVMTANLREWRHVFVMRCSNKAHPQIRVLLRDCLRGFATEFPVIFDDLVGQFVS